MWRLCIYIFILHPLGGFESGNECMRAWWRRVDGYRAMSVRPSSGAGGGIFV